MSQQPATKRNPIYLCSPVNALAEGVYKARIPYSVDQRTWYPTNIRAGIQFINSLEFGLPMSLDYLTLDFQRDIEDGLDLAEK